MKPKYQKIHTYSIASMMLGLLLLAFIFSIEYNSHFGLDYLFHYDHPYYHFIVFVGQWLFVPITIMFGYFAIYDFKYKKKGYKTLKTEYPKKCPRCNDDLEKYVACELKCKSCGGIIDCSDDQ